MADKCATCEKAAMFFRSVGGGDPVLSCEEHARDHFGEWKSTTAMGGLQLSAARTAAAFRRSTLG